MMFQKLNSGVDTSLHVLIVDDDTDDTDFLITAFNKRLPATRFSISNSGQKAIELLGNVTDAAEHPDVVFLDLHMPGLNGYYVLTELRKIEGLKDLPIIVISTAARDIEADRCLAQGGTHYFTKPTSIEAYDDIVSITLEQLEFGRR